MRETRPLLYGARRCHRAVDDIESLARLVVLILYLITWASIAGFLLWVIRLVRATVPEVLQLRVVQEMPHLQRAFICLTGGTLAGTIAVAPAILLVVPSAWWSLSWISAWSATTIYGLTNLIRFARVPIVRSASVA